MTLVGGAFMVGARLHAWQDALLQINRSSAQANALLKLTPECSPVVLDKISPNDSQNKELICNVLKLLKTHYVEPVTAERESALARGAARGILASLNDTDSHFVDPTERKLLDEAAEGKFHGIGAILALRNEKIDKLDIMKIIVVAPMPGSPAEKAGLRTGDSITDINGKWIVTHDPFQEPGLKKLAEGVVNKEVDDFTYQEALKAADKKLKEGVKILDALENLTAKSSEEISIRVERPGRRKPIEFAMRCEDTQVDPVTSCMLKQDMAYVRISQFNTRATKEFSEELDKALAGHAKALVLDLRNNPGGSISAATAITSKITGGGKMATIQEKTRSRILWASKARRLDIPIAVLINEGTASVAELAAGTLRDNATAALVGTKTFGDGLVQTPLLLRDGSAAILTTGKMLTAKGLDFNRKGLKPDKTVLQPNNGHDVQLEKAEGILLTKLGKA